MLFGWSRFRTTRLVDQLAARARRVPFSVWFLILLVATRLGYELGIVPPLDWLPGEPRR